MAIVNLARDLGQEKPVESRIPGLNSLFAWFNTKHELCCSAPGLGTLSLVRLDVVAEAPRIFTN
jgi:hypothetical protein